MRKYEDPFRANVPLNSEQKKAINNFKSFYSKKLEIKPPKKIKFYCPFKKDDYTATLSHQNCQLCNEGHEIIVYDRKIHPL